MRKGHFYTGCSGYYYSNWKNKFYPQGLKPANWLTYYSTVFNTVELNGTFYKKPTLASLQKYAAATGPDFKFSVKMSRFITHIKRLNGCRQEIEDFHHLIEQGLAEKLACVLYQMPPSFGFSQQNLERVLTAVAPSPHHVIEFRNAGWWNDDVYKALTKHKITMCNVDFPGLEVPFAKTGKLFYLRMHGNPVLFKSAYSTEEIQSFYARIPKTCNEHYIYFNNTYFDAGYTNAFQMQQLRATSPVGK